MKKLLIILTALILTGCGIFDTPQVLTSVPTSALGTYEAAGGTGIHVVEDNAVGLMTTATARIDGTLVILDLANCNYAIDAFAYDPVNALFWVSQPITIEYDPVMVQCGQMTCGATGASMVGSVVEATFSCI